jgi:hypothetical protein
MLAVRTTITLDPDTVALVHKAMAERKASFKEIVNDAIVRGLTAAAAPVTFRTKTRSLGRALVDLDKATQIAAQLDDAELLRTAEQGL